MYEPEMFPALPFLHRRYTMYLEMIHQYFYTSTEKVYMNKQLFSITLLVFIQGSLIASGKHASRDPRVVAARASVVMGHRTRLTVEQTVPVDRYGAHDVLPAANNTYKDKSLKKFIRSPKKAVHEVAKVAEAPKSAGKQVKRLGKHLKKMKF